MYECIWFDIISNMFVTTIYNCITLIKNLYSLTYQFLVHYKFHTCMYTWSKSFTHIKWSNIYGSFKTNIGKHANCKHFNMRKCVENSLPHFVVHFVRQLFSFCYMMKNILKSLYIGLNNFICGCCFALVVKSIQTFNENFFLTFCAYVLYFNKTN
jgi:hypothetical protein